MNKNYDNFLNVSLTTKIKEFIDGYYLFEDTVFYGEKGGMLSDNGKINNLEVQDLKWIGDKLYHKVDGILKNPINMQVNLDGRFINTSIQSALHILDGFYEKLDIKIVAIGVNPSNQWYEINTKELPKNHLDDVSNFMNNVIRDDVNLNLSYIKGCNYNNPDYKKYDFVRIVEFKNLDSQPCSTLHVNKTSQIQSFVVLDSEKTSRGTRIHITCNIVTNQRLKEYHSLIKDISHKLSGTKDDIIPNLDKILKDNKDLKSENEALKKEVLTFKAKEILNDIQKIKIYDNCDLNSLRYISMYILPHIENLMVIISDFDNTINVSIISKNDNAKNIFEKIKQEIEVSGGGNSKVICFKTNNQKEELINIIKKVI